MITRPMTQTIHMYLWGKNWSYEDDFYKSNDYASSLTAILQVDPRPSNPADVGVITSPPPSTVSVQAEK